MSAQNISVQADAHLREKAVHTVSLNRLRSYMYGGTPTRSQIASGKLWDQIWEWLDSDVATGYWFADIDVTRIQTYEADFSRNCPYVPADFATRFSFTDPDTAFAFKLRFA